MLDSNPVESILRMAIAKEQTSIRFYEDMAGRSTGEPSKSIFEVLAKEEMKHKAQLELELTKLGYIVTPGQYLSDSTMMYYQSDEEYPVNASYEEALKTAIEREKRAFRLYVDLARAINDPETIDMLLSLAEEEVRHKLMFEAEYNTLKQGNP